MMITIGVSLAAVIIGLPELNKIKSPAGSSLQEASNVQIQSSYAKLPLSFIKNDGQVDKKVKFYERGSGHATFFAQDGVHLSLGSSPRPAVSSEGLAQTDVQDASEAKQAHIKLVPLGANKHPEIVAEGMQEGKVDYFVGNDPMKWKTNIPTYQAVVYKEIYPGIDLKFYGNNRQMEYDIIVQPGADPSIVKFAYEGIEGLRVTADGDLEIGLSDGTILQKKPIIYQEINGKRVEVAGTFNVQPATNRHAKSFAYGFEIASYDKAHLLLIDPILVYSTYLGGESDDLGQGIAVDGSGNSYVVGYGNSLNFPTVNPLQGPHGGTSWDVFVTKFNSAGNALIYSTFLGGSNNDIGSDIALDASGNAYLTGHTDSTDFPTASPLQAYGGNTDAFVVKINSAGNALLYSTYFGGSNYDIGSDIALDASGNAHVTGSTNSSNFPTANPLQAALGGSNDAFVANINSAGSAVVYSTYLGGSGDEEGRGIAVDASGNAYLTGRTTSTNFPTANPLQPTFGGDYDAFVTKLNAAGSALIYSTYLGGSGYDVGNAIAVDGSGNAYITGQTGSTNFPIANPLQRKPYSPRYANDAFVTKLNSFGSALVYSTYLGGSYNDGANAIAVDGSGNAYVMGRTDFDPTCCPIPCCTGFPTVNRIPGTYGGGTQDAFVTKFNSSGSKFLYSTRLGGSRDEEGSGIAVDAVGNAYVTGETTSTDFPTVNPFQAANATSRDAFVAKIATPNQPPNADGVTPSNSMTEAGMSQMFTAAYSDPDGWQNIAAANLYFSGNGGMHNEWLHYLIAPNLFTMMGSNDSCSPGQMKMLTNGYLTLDCSFSSVSGSGNTLTVVFQATPEMPSSGIHYNIFSAASDQYGAAHAIFAGTWDIE
jgi:hypothetical protein